MKPFDYYSKNKFSYPSKKDYLFFNVYQEDKCLRLKGTIEDVYEVPEVSKLITGAAFPKNDYQNAVIDFCKKNGIFIVDYYDEEGYNKHKTDYNAYNLQLRREFKRDALEDLGITDNPKAQLLFDKAWDKGWENDDGGNFEKVYNYLDDLAELIK